MDDSINMAKQLRTLLIYNVLFRIFTDSRSLLESIGSSNQVAEKSLHQPVASLMQNLENEEVEFLPG